MNKFIKGFACACVGFVAGFCVSHVIEKKKYVEKIEEELESIERYRAIKKKVVASTIEEVKEETPVSEPEEIEKLVKKYTKPEDEEWPYVITPEEFGAIEGYSEVSLILYDDDFLVERDTNEVIDDVDDVVGLDNLDRIGEYEEDAIHIRDDSRQVDYEIIKDERNWRHYKREE